MDGAFFNTASLMNWQLLSVSCIVFWGSAAIILSKTVKGQDAGLVSILYNGALFFAAITFALSQGSWKELPSLKTGIVPFVVAAGILSGLATIGQIWAFKRFPAEVPWIVLIGGFYPLLPILYGLLTGTKPSPAQWTGMAFAFAAIVCFSLPGKSPAQ